MTEARTEWAVRYTHYDQSISYDYASDRAHAELIADGKATHIESLNQPTREFNGIYEVDVVSRTVTVDDDGTKTLRSWQFERPGKPEARA